MMVDGGREKVERIRARYSDAVEDVVTEGTDVPIVYIRKGHLLDFLRSLRTKDGLEFNFLSDLTAYDDNPPLDIPDYGLGTVTRPGGEHRFVVVYQLLSLQSLDRLRVKVRVKDGEETPSVTPIWKAADWLEREVFDMYGVRFSGHPNLRRIMLDDRWEGHPQRKDYPIKRYQRFEGAATLDSLGLDGAASGVSSASPVGPKPQGRQEAERG